MQDNIATLTKWIVAFLIIFLLLMLLLFTFLKKKDTKSQPSYSRTPVYHY